MIEAVPVLRGGVAWKDATTHAPMWTDCREDVAQEEENNEEERAEKELRKEAGIHTTEEAESQPAFSPDNTSCGNELSKSKETERVSA